MNTDEATINFISNNQKPQNAKVVRFIVNVNRILNVLREFDGNCSKKQLAEKLPDFDFDNKANLEELSQYNRIKYDPVREIFELKSEYNIKNIEDLKQLIKTRKNGILEDEMLNDSYPGIKNDIEKLKKENIVKVIENTEKKCNVLFYRDMADEFEKIIINPEYQEAICELRKIWKEELNNIPLINTTILYNKRPRDDNNIEPIKPTKKRKTNK